MHSTLRLDAIHRRFGSWVFIASAHRWLRHGVVLEPVDSAMTPYSIMRTIQASCPTCVHLDCLSSANCFKRFVSGTRHLRRLRSSRNPPARPCARSVFRMGCRSSSVIRRGVMVVATAGFVTMGLLLARTTTNGCGMSSWRHSTNACLIVHAFVDALCVSTRTIPKIVSCATRPFSSNVCFRSGATLVPSRRVPLLRPSLLLSTCCLTPCS